jgi:hypothetical protein
MYLLVRYIDKDKYNWYKGKMAATKVILKHSDIITQSQGGDEITDD